MMHFERCFLSTCSLHMNAEASTKGLCEQSHQILLHLRVTLSLRPQPHTSSILNWSCSPRQLCPLACPPSSLPLPPSSPSYRASCKTLENTVVFFFSDGTFVQNCKLVFKKGYSIALFGMEFQLPLQLSLWLIYFASLLQQATCKISRLGSQLSIRC